MNRKKTYLLGDRMKDYEKSERVIFDTSRPIILRLDGKAFHTYTKNFTKPFDSKLSFAMQETMKYLCENIADCRIGYTQSDEITLVLTSNIHDDYSPWYGNQLQKILSVATSLCTYKFNQLMNQYTEVPALFDCRIFTVPNYIEAANCIYWRQTDGRRNSIQMLAQSLYPHRELQGLSVEELDSKMKDEKNVLWSSYPNYNKWGSICKKTDEGWTIDGNTPIVKDDWEYIYSELRVTV